MRSSPTDSTTTIAGDRLRLPVGELAVLTLATSMSVGFATLTVPAQGRSVVSAFGAGAIAGALAVLALRSLPVRWVARCVAAVGALMLARFGRIETAGTLDAAGGLIGWALSTAVVFVVATRAEHRSANRSRVERTGRSRLTLLRDGLAVAAIVAGATLTVGPSAATRFDQGAKSGDAADFRNFDRSNPLAAATQLDMTSRPQLTDRLVLTVETDTPTFWRTQTFDVWNGSQWTRNDNRRAPIASGRIRHSTDDIGATGTQVIRQTFRLAAPYGVVLPAAPSPVRIETNASLSQDRDGALLPDEPIGRDAMYSVTSRRAVVTDELLRASDDNQVPREILDRYTRAPATRRVRQMAHSVTDGATNDYERVRRLIDWLGGRVTYSLNAPLSPAGTDVVDHFLFESRVGWCEQIASSLVVMLRQVGVPARLATGFVPSERNKVTHRYEVRERDAHAWTEVWFPRVGWVPFDPTANIALSGEAAAVSASTADRLVDNLGIVLVVLGAAAMLAEPAVRLARRLVRLVSRRPHRGHSAVHRRVHRWEATMESRLDKLGRKVAHPRAPTETASTYSGVLGAQWADERLVRVGEIIDRSLYAPDPPPDDDRRFVEATLDELGNSKPPVAHASEV